MNVWERLRLHGRLFVSSLLVIAIASATLYLTSVALTPALFGWHLTHFGAGRGRPSAAVPR